MKLNARISKRNKRYLGYISQSGTHKVARGHTRQLRRRVGNILFGDAGWYWHAYVKDHDIIIRGVIATWFGGSHDPQDNGETASGVNTKDKPDVVGCALPMPGFGVASTEGSPLPRIPWFTNVRVGTPKGDWIDCALIDLGPSRYTNHGIDLTVRAFEKLGGNLNDGLMSVDYLVEGGAAYLL